MRKILFVVNEAYFFMTHRVALARAAADAGYEVHVAAPSHHTWAPDDFSVDVLIDAGFTWHEIPLSRRGTNPLQDLRTLASLARLFRKLSPDVIHLITIKPFLYGAIAARLTGMQAVVGTVTGLGQIFVASGARASFLRSIVRLLYRVALRHPNMAVIIQNPNDGEVLVSTGAVKPDRLTLIRGSGVSLEEYAPVDEPAGPPVVILAARLIWEKGVGDFAAAAEKLLAEGIQARFVLVGDTQPSNPRAVPVGQIEAWCEAGTLEWWGRRKDMPDVLRNSHIVCLPTSYGEGVPRILIEAAASGRPIVSTDIPGCLEVNLDLQTGIVVPVHDVSALAEALASLIASPEMRKRLGRNGRILVTEELSDTIVITKTLEVYEEISDRSICASDR